MLSGKAMSFINNPEAPLLNAGLPENELFVIKDQDLLKVSPADFSGGYIGIVSDSILTHGIICRDGSRSQTIKFSLCISYWR